MQKRTIAHNSNLRTTVCLSYNESELLFTFAICNDLDQFVKKVGVAKVLGRLKAERVRFDMPPYIYANKCVVLNTTRGEEIKKKFLDFFQNKFEWGLGNDKDRQLIRWLGQATY